MLTIVQPILSCTSRKDKVLTAKLNNISLPTQVNHKQPPTVPKKDLLNMKSPLKVPQIISPGLQSKRTSNKTQMNAIQRRIGSISPISEYQLIPNHNLHSNHKNRNIHSSGSQFASSFNEFEECSKCDFAKSSSLDAWMDHLGSLHPVPTNWLSDRAHSLTGIERNHPYTAVVDSHKKRKAETVPRPLNSFMIFAQYIRRLVLYVFPEAPNVHISQRIGHLWRTMNLELRGEYSLEAQRLQELHAIEFPDYKYRPRKRLRTSSLIPSNYAESKQRQEEEIYMKLGQNNVLGLGVSPRKQRHLSDNSNGDIDVISTSSSPVLKSRSHGHRANIKVDHSPYKSFIRVQVPLNSSLQQDNVDGILSGKPTSALAKRPAILTNRTNTNHQPVILRKSKQNIESYVISSTHYPTTKIDEEASLIYGISSDAPLTALVSNQIVVNRNKIKLETKSFNCGMLNDKDLEPLAVLTSGGLDSEHPSPFPSNIMLYSGQLSQNSGGNIFGSLTPSGSSISPNSCINGPHSDLSRGDLSAWQSCPSALEIKSEINDLLDFERERCEEPPTIRSVLKPHVRVSKPIRLHQAIKLECFDECANLQAPIRNFDVTQGAFADICTSEVYTSLDDLNTLSLFQPSNDRCDEIFKVDDCTNWETSAPTEDENNNTIPYTQKVD